MKQIVLLTDFSENSFQAILYAMHFFEKQKVFFHVLHVKDSRGLMLDDLMTSTANESMQKVLFGNAKKELEELLVKINAENNNAAHQFKTEYLFDHFFEAISKYCKKESIEMLVMGTTGATGAKQVFLGSIAAKVINKVNIPTLAIPKNVIHEPLDKILFSIDYLVDYLPITMIPLLDILDENESELTVVYANEKDTDLTVDQQLNKEELKRILADYKYKGHTINGLALNSVISCLTDYLAANLIVMIKKDRGIISKLFNSSHIRKISYHTKKPLLILPERPILFD